MGKSRFSRVSHKWVGLIFSIFIILFAISGILMNHRKGISHIDLPRGWLPKHYSYNNWNNSAVKGTIVQAPNEVLIYGGAGIWQIDSLQSEPIPYMEGLKKGADNRNTNAIAKTPSGDIFAATTFDLYRLGDNEVWQNLSHLLQTEDRLTDLAVRGDSLVLLSRSHAFFSLPPYEAFTQVELAKPTLHSRKATLFRTLWLLHSGQLYGLPGILLVDLLGVLMILLSVTGIIYFISPGIIRRRRRKKKEVKCATKTMGTSIRWHNKVGSWLLVLFVLLAFTGMFLRPPLMIAIIRSKVSPPVGSVLDSPNPWHDKLRVLRYDDDEDEWLLYTSSGFYTLKHLHAVPKKLLQTPPVSVMGVSVLEKDGPNWMVGSFSGIYSWNRAEQLTINLHTGLPVMPSKRSGRPVFDHKITGFSHHLGEDPVVFDYSHGAYSLGASPFSLPMPTSLGKGRISLWHTAQEVHVGRAYEPFLGPFSQLFVFLAGILVIFILITGYIVYRKRYKKRRKRTSTKA